MIPSENDKFMSSDKLLPGPNCELFIFPNIMPGIHRKALV